MKASIIILLFYPFIIFCQNTGIIKIKSESGIQIFLDSELIGTTSNKFSGLLIEDTPSGDHTLRAVYKGATYFEDIVFVKQFQVSYVKLPPLPKEKKNVENIIGDVTDSSKQENSIAFNNWFHVPPEDSKLLLLENVFTKFISYYHNQDYRNALPYAWYLLTENPYYALNLNVFSLTDATINKLISEYMLTYSDSIALNSALYELQENKTYYMRSIDSPQDRVIQRRLVDRNNSNYSELISPIPILGLDEIHQRLIYPPNAQRLGVRGKVYLKLFITEMGNIDNIEVIKGLTTECNQAAINALMDTKFIYHTNMEVKYCTVQITFPPNLRSNHINSDSPDSIIRSFNILTENHQIQLDYDLYNNSQINNYFSGLRIVLENGKLLIPEKVIGDFNLSSDKESYQTTWIPSQYEIKKIGFEKFKILLSFYKTNIYGFKSIPISFLSEYITLNEVMVERNSLVEIMHPSITYGDTVSVSSKQLNFSGRINQTNEEFNSIFVNETLFFLDEDNNFNIGYKLKYGINEISIAINYVTYKKEVFKFFVSHGFEPSLTQIKIYNPLLSIENTAITKVPGVQIFGGILSKSEIINFSINTNKIELSGDKKFEIYQSLKPGVNNFSLKYTNEFNISGEFKFSIEYQIDSTPPDILIIYPPLNSLQELKKTKITMHGRVIHENDFYKLLINEKTVELDSDNEFLYELELRKGDNYIRIEAYDNFGNKGTKNIKLTL